MKSETLGQAVSLMLLDGTGDLLGASDDSGNGGQSGNDGGKSCRDFASALEELSKFELLFGGLFGEIHF